jgi:hypothetical protein
MTKHKSNRILKIFLSVLTWLFIMPYTQAQFSIGPGGWVTVKPGGSLMIDTDVNIKSVAGASGYLVDQNVNGDIDITGDVTVERYLAPDIWHNVSSPVSDETSACYIGTDLVFWYDEALILNDWNFGWVWYYGPTGGPLVVFRGYDVLFYNNPVTVDYMATGAEDLNTGPYSLTVINTSSTPSEIPSHKGWNLLGNPYPSPVDWLASSGWNKSDINDAKYIWDGTNNIYTIYLGGGSPIGINGGTRFIPSNQGFWVQSVVSSGSVSINNATRVGDITGTPDFYKEAPVDYPLVSLLTTGEEYQDEVVIRFIAGTSVGFDINWDATKLLSINPDVPQLILRNGNQSFALNTLPEIKDGLHVNIDFRCAREGVYDIRLSGRTNLDRNCMLYLKDELERKTVCLSNDSCYTFFHSPANPLNRFKLYFNPDNDIINDITPDSWFTVYSHGSTVTIIKNTINRVRADLILYNMLGQPVWKKSLGDNKETTFQVSLPSGTYIASIVTEQHIANSKIIIRKP